ncbi:MAG: hypothetical protein GY828_08170 [Candidatus Gracilibacteria bacterium]|nr:hypothetical protein [Candidatus Gracilibacteria bacterium]
MNLNNGEYGEKSVVVPNACWSRKAARKWLEVMGYPEDILLYEGTPMSLAHELEILLEQGNTVILPIHNINGGNVSKTLGALTALNSEKIEITSVVKQKIEHQLFGMAGQENDLGAGTIFSHPQALSQCSDKIQDSGMKKSATQSTTYNIENIEPGQFFLLDNETGRNKGLTCYDENFGPEDNYTYFVEINNKSAKKPKGIMEDLDIGVIKVDNQKGDLLLQLLPLVLSGVDLKQITSVLDTEKNTAHIGVMLEKNIGGIINKLISKHHGRGIPQHFMMSLKQKLSDILDVENEILIDAQNNEIIVNNKQGALIEVLALLESAGINLLGINSKVHPDDKNKIIFEVETDISLDSLEGKNYLDAGMKKEIIQFIEKNKDKIQGITLLNENIASEKNKAIIREEKTMEAELV